MSTFGSIYSVRSGLDAARRALDVVGQNVANANTHGYTRQEVSHIAAEPTNVIKSAGRGIADTLVLRYRDEFLDRQFRSRAGLQGFYDSLSAQLGQVEQIVGDLSQGGLRTALDQFFSAWDTLSSRPSDSAARAQVVTAAEQFLDTAQAAFQELAGVRTTVDEMVRDKVGEVNSAARQIAVLNQEIMRQEVGARQTANELRDERDRLVDSLAKLAGTTTVTHSDGAVTVHLGSMPIVDRHMSFPVDSTVALEADLDSDPVLSSVRQNMTSLTWNGTTNPAQFLSGEVAGLLKLRDEIVPQYMKGLDNLVRTIATEVNTIHTAPDAGGTAQIAFFTAADGTSPLGIEHMNIAINPAITADPSKIIAAQNLPVPPAVPAAHDGGRALAIARLRSAAVVSGTPVSAQKLTPSEYLRAVSSQLGIITQQAQRQSEAAALQVAQAEKQRQSVSGVSLDDEMTKMIQFQQTYNAAARMMTTLDEMLDVVVNRIGLVGR
ncbi:MAG TPA: flagellar hook-associated protein FlgK [Symbiobacteriaceae bacterium]|nr:flagellar hook-associated protein FlgK [Symbiobacteriaceae bacterium]